MAITARVKSQYFQQDQKLIRLAPNQDHSLPTKRADTPWTPQEHDLFLEALEQYPSGPWKDIAAHIGTRTTRQTMTHAQKYREKIARRRKAEEVASPTSNATQVVVEHHQATLKAPVRTTPHVRDAKEPVKREEELNETHCKVGELELDGSVLELLENFEPYEMVSGLESWDPAIDSWHPKSAPSDLVWLISSPFQHCIPFK